MKTSILSRSYHLLTAGIIAGALVLPMVAHAGLQIPYTPDADTLHLYHFDDPVGLTVTDAVVSASIPLTNQVQTQVPGTQITLGNPAALAQLATCLQITPTNFSAGNAYGFAVNRTSWADTTPFRNPTSGAFTFEALIKCTGNPYVANGNWEIIAGDSGNASRSWQFRIQTGTQPQLNFNFINGGPNTLVSLPKSGPNIFLQNVWYHVAVSYTGDAPTNSDPAQTLTFYWTVLDGGRTNASVLLTTNLPSASTLGGNPVLGVGGSARNTSGVANGEGFKGYIDEVRISDIARGSNEMAYSSGITPTLPVFLQEPPTNTLVGHGQPLTLPALVTGGPVFRWYRDGSLVSGQSDSTLFIPSVTFGDGGSYQLIASNSVGMATSVVAQVTIGAVASELFVTGVDTNGALAEALSVDPHYILLSSADVNNLGPNALVWNMGGFPIAQFGGGGTFSNPDGVSQWIGEQAANNAGYTSPTGQYVYRTTFVLDTVDLGQPFTLSGVWWVNDNSTDILINGQSTGFVNSSGNSVGGKNTANFVITNKFVAGLNTMDFVTQQPAGAGQPESALRVEMTSIGFARAPGLPVINNQPTNVTVRENGHATFAVVALGRPPLSYQWYADGTAVTDATNRTLALDPVFTGGQGTNFTVVVSNDSGSVTSTPPAVLTLTTNRPPIPPLPFQLVTYSNTPVNLSVASIVYGSSDPDNDPITFITFDGNSTNFGAINLDGINLTYLPPADYTGPDQYSYTISDSIDFSIGFVQINVQPLLAPTVSIVSKSGNNIVFSGAGGAPGGSYTVLTTTNVTTALPEWTVLSTGNFDGSGQFSITTPFSAGTLQRYYTLQVP